MLAEAVLVHTLHLVRLLVELAEVVQELLQVTQTVAMGQPTLAAEAVEVELILSELLAVMVVQVLSFFVMRIQTET
jgi:hypothetical protein